jgi:ParB/RepB/Spo0J family partition protein
VIVRTGESQLLVLPVSSIRPCPYQPRVNVSVDLVRRLAASMVKGRHEPLIEVEPILDEPARYQIVCGEQRWRAAVEAGLKEVLVRLHPRLAYLERLEKQCEENRLRKDLDPVEEAHGILLHKTLRDISQAELLLANADIPCTNLDEKHIVRREQFVEHLRALERLLVESETHVVVRDGQLRPRPLARWRETEIALGISESARKAKVGILRLPPELQDRVRHLSREHAAQIGRLPTPEHQQHVVERADQLTHRQVRDLVDRLLREGDGEQGAAAPDPIPTAPESVRMVDLCRQLARLIRNLDAHATTDERAWATKVIADLRQTLDAFVESA